MARYVPSWRDRLAWRLATAALRLATPTYRALLGGTWRIGLATALKGAPVLDATPRPLFADGHTDNTRQAHERTTE